MLASPPSLDAARQQVALYGNQLMTKAIQLADQASDRLSKIPGISLFKPTELPKPGCMTFDRTRLTLNVTHLGLSGFEADEILPLEKAVGRISAELVCPYPPGIPALMPGEAIAPATLNYLQHVLTLGSLVSIKGCSDSTLRTLKVVR